MRRWTSTVHVCRSDNSRRPLQHQKMTATPIAVTCGQMRHGDPQRSTRLLSPTPYRSRMKPMHSEFPSIIPGPSSPTCVDYRLQRRCASGSNSSSIAPPSLLHATLTPHSLRVVSFNSSTRPFRFSHHRARAHPPIDAFPAFEIPNLLRVDGCRRGPEKPRWRNGQPAGAFFHQSLKRFLVHEDLARRLVTLRARSGADDLRSRFLFSRQPFRGFRRASFRRATVRHGFHLRNVSECITIRPAFERIANPVADGARCTSRGAISLSYSRTCFRP